MFFGKFYSKFILFFGGFFSFSGLNVGRDRRGCRKATIPSFDLEIIGKTSESVHSLNGKINVINFWFLACRPCLAKIPELNELVNEFGKENVNYLAISPNDVTSIEKYLLINEYKFDHLADGDNLIKNVFKHISGYTYTIITNKEMKIVAIFDRNNFSTEKMMEKLLEILSKE